MNQKKFSKLKLQNSIQNVKSQSLNLPYQNKYHSKNKQNQTLLVPIGNKWHCHRIIENVPKNQNSSLKLNHKQITQLRSEAIQILKSDYYIYDQLKVIGSKNEDFEWIKIVLNNGTVNDKLAAYTVLIQDSAVYNLKSIEMLIRFVNPKGKRECIMAIDTIRDLFIGDLLIPQKKLSTFEELVNSVNQDFLLNSDSNDVYRKKFLLMAHVEDQIRSFYNKFLNQLVTCSHDTLETLKIKSIRTMFDLFVNNSEQEKYLLESLTNKLGDPMPKIASSTVRLLSQILKHHPQMKMIIVKEVERLLFRTNITNRTQYYCLCFFSEIIFKANVDQELANRIIITYFSIFTKCTKLGEINNKTMSVLLTGVSRAFPYSKLEHEIIEKYLNTFYRLIHYVNKNTAIQTLSLIFNMVNFNESGSLTDRFYTMLYRFLLDTTLDQCKKLSLLLNIVYRSIKKDPVIKRTRAFVKRLLQLALSSSSSFVIAVLILVSELLKTKESFRLNIVQTENKAINFNDEEKDEMEANGFKTKSWVYVDYKDNVNKCDTYRFDVRNPLYANAEFEPFWELLILQNHFHPTVQMFARKLIRQESFEYDGDPLEDFSLKRFLDRFSFKNPKRIDESKISNKVFCRTRLANKAKSNINSEEYLNQKEDEVPVDERFIFKFLQQRKSIKKQQKSKDSDDDESDIESVTSLEFNDLLDNYEKYVGYDNFQNIDFSKHLTAKQHHLKNEDDEADFDEEFDSEDSVCENDYDDQEFISDNYEENEDLNLEEQDFKIKKPRNAAPFMGKRGVSSITNDIFASAEQFDYLLEQNEADSDLEFDDDNYDGQHSNKKRKRNPLRKNQKIKSIKKSKVK